MFGGSRGHHVSVAGQRMNLLPVLISLLSVCNHEGVPSPQLGHAANHQPAGISLLAGAGRLTQVRTLHLMAMSNEERGNLDLAGQLYRRELELLSQIGESGRVPSAQISLALAGVYQIQGRFSDAESAYRKSLGYLPQAGYQDDRHTARAWEGMYWLYQAWGKSSDAESVLKKAMRVMDKLPEASAERIHFLDSEAVALCQSGRYAEAEKNWLNALHLGESAYPNDTRQFGEVLTHLGQMYSALGEYKSAEEFLDRSLKAHEKAQGLGVVSRAVLQTELGIVYARTHRWTDADTLFQQALQVANSVGSTVPVGCSLILERAGDFQMARHNWETAEGAYRRALAIRQDLAGDDSSVAESLVSLSQALQKLHRKKEAQSCRDRAAQIAATRNAPLPAGQTVDVRAFRASQ